MPEGFRPGGPRGPRGARGSRGPRGSGGPRRLSEPHPIRVQWGAGGRPTAVDGRAVDAVRESWLVEDRWWTDAPLRRRYWEVVTIDGRNSVVFRELQRGTWYRQR